MASRCCCKEVYRYPHNNYKYFLYTPLVLGLFLAAASLLLCSFKKNKKFGLVSVIFLQYIANVTHRTFEIVQKKSRSREYKNYLIISVFKNVEHASTARARESRDFHVRGTESGPNDV